MSLRSVSDSLHFTEDVLRDKHSKVLHLRQQLVALRNETNITARDVTSSFQTASASKTASPWTSLHSAMKRRVLGSASSSSSSSSFINPTGADEDDSSVVAPATLVDAILFSTMTLNCWFLRVCIPQMQAWTATLDSFDRRLAAAHARASDPRVRAFCRDLRRRRRIAAAVGPAAMQEGADNAAHAQDNSNRQQHVEAEYCRAQAVRREADTAARRRALSHLNVQLAQAVNVMPKRA
jgi:hypothetical protein